MAVPAAPDSGVRWNALDWAGAPFALRINALVQNTKARTLRIAVSFLAPPKTVSTSDRWFKGAYRPKVNADVPAEIVAELRSVFKPRWRPTVVGMVLDAGVDWGEVAELVTESYCVLAPKKLVALVERPTD